MKPLSHLVRRKRRAAVDAAMLFVVVLLAVQMWLLTATLESYLAGHVEVALPAMILSGLLCTACFAIYRFVTRLDRTPAPTDVPSTHGPWEIGSGAAPAPRQAPPRSSAS